MQVLSRLTIVVLIASVLGCDKNTESAAVQPVAYFSMSPLSGNTTTIFRFNADSALGPGTRNNPVLLRWDWESDGIWDRMYSTGGEITHRFYKKGNYRILMEASTIGGLRDTMVAGVEIIQGYSPPRAAFTMSPDSANITNEFNFDASVSKDDEDSLDQLEFRWDFTGDRSWDTGFSRNPLAVHKYAGDSRYPVRLEVRDPQQMTSIGIDTLVVTRLNDRIVPVFTYECWPCTLEDTIRLDAGKSFYLDKPDAKLLYSWDIGDDNIWEVTLSESPFFKKFIGAEGKFAVLLRVTDDQGLYMDFTDSVELFPLNMPPVTRLVIGNPIGNTSTRFYLHVRGSSDRDNSYLDLRARWDINNDGIWESEYDNQNEIYLTFPATGKYPVRVMMTDPNNKSSEATDTVWVVAGNHETGLLEDKRGGSLPTYYGIVKIGDRWWMQSNLKYAPLYRDWYADYYNNNFALGQRYGALYPHIATYSSNPAACPKGWHIPKITDWQQLMTDLGTDGTIDRLMEGGLSEMHILLAGQKDYGSNSPNTKDKFSGLGLMANFWTSDTTLTGQASGWYIDPIRKQNRAALVGKNYWYPVRCIRD